MKKLKWLAALALIAGLVLCMFYPYLLGDKVLMSTDAAIAHANKSASQVFSDMAARWQGQKLLGVPAMPSISLPALIKAFLPPVLWNNLIYVLGCALAACALGIYLSRRGLGIASAALAGIAAFFTGTNLTLLYAGHVLKPYTLLFFVLALLSVPGASAGGLLFALIWGGCVGLMFVQQPDVAFFSALFAGAFLLFQLWRQQGARPVIWLKVLLPAAGMAFLFAAGPLLSGYKYHVKDTAQVQNRNAEQKWNYVTQWSVPPDELVDFVAPGYYGWRSGDPEGPYWGRTGRSADWEKTKQGFQNFKLESTYIGFIPVAFALFALFACRRSRHRSEILFWAIAAAIALLLSFGRYFPLYALFYKLPVVSNIRNPNKIIQVFQICLAILAAYGFDALFGRRGGGQDETGFQKPLRAFFWTAVGMFALLGLGALVTTLGMDAHADHLVGEGWSPEIAGTMAQNRAVAMRHSVFLAGIVTAFFAVFYFPGLKSIARHRGILAAALVLVVAVDAVKLSKHYVKEMPRSFIEANALTDYLNQNLGDSRVALLSQQGMFNSWITYLLPYQKIPTFNIEQMPRMGNDYKSFIASGQRDPLAMWRFSAVKYLLAPTAAEGQLVPAGCRKVYSFSLADGGGGNYSIISDVNGPVSVFELTGALPRAALFSASRKVSDEEALAGIGSLNEVLLPEDSLLPELSGNGLTGWVETLSRDPGKVRLRVMTEVPAILRVAEKYDPGWVAKLDGKVIPVGRVDYLCQGLAIPPGEHEVILHYAPGKGYFLMQCAGGLLLFGAVVVIGIKRKNEHAED